MIPIKLELQGLYSYKEKQTIDFTQLTAAGLFGIFGAVGSGKSSILEAIMLALYGNTERLAARGEKTSMVNLQSEVLSIAFEFKAGKNNAETYKATYVSKRNKKNFDDVKPAEHLFYQKIDGGWLPIEKNAQEILGMKIDHFRQTVIIPQGKFRDFIEQKPLARAEMMKELFGLERFDLSSHTGKLMRENNEEKIRYQTQLQGLEDINPDRQRGKEQLKDTLTQHRAAQEKQLKTIENQVNQLKTLREKHQQLRLLEQQQEEVLKERPAVEKRKAQLQKFRRALTYIKPILDQLKEKELEVEKYKVSYTDCSRWKRDFEAEVAQLEIEEQKLKIQQSKKSEREARIRDLRKIITIQTLRRELAVRQKVVDELRPKSEAGKKLLVELQQNIADLEAQEELVKLPDLQTLTDLKGMAKDFEQLQQTQASLLSDLQLLEQQKAAIDKQIQAIKKLLPQSVDNFTQWLSRQEERLHQAQKDRETLIQRQGLSTFALQLKEGESCPLCGATEHPAPLPHHFDDKDLEENAARILQLKADLDAIRGYQSALEKEALQLNYVQHQILQKRNEQSLKKAELEKLASKLSSQGLASKEQLLKLLDSYEETSEKQQQIVQQQKKLRKESQALQEKLSQAEGELRSAEQALITLHATVDSQKGEIKYPDMLNKYLDQTEGAIRSDIEKVQSSIDELELRYTRTQDRLKDARHRQATNLANLQHFEKLLESTKHKHASLQDELAQQLLAQAFESQQEVQQVLALSIQPDQWEQEIQAFESLSASIMVRLGELHEQPEVLSFDEEQFDQLISSMQAEREILDKQNAELALLHREIEEIQAKLNQKSSLLEALEKIEKRELNLKVLEKLFKGAGFVKFVSSIYLKELCQTANLRFMRLTKNSLSLEIDEDNNFWVRDYLNGGKKRLLKSLSGGQTFQASLCLALALAEKVKSLNRADQSFFFLDEGFGSLDRASLRTVFEALKSLRHEHRVVGIISHVEELQQEIEVFAKVELDSERGSQITYSF